MTLDFFSPLAARCAHTTLDSQIFSESLKHDFRINVDGGVEPHLLLFFELNLFFVDSDTLRFSGEVLVVVLGERLVPVVNGCSGSADAEPLAEVAALRQRGCGGVSSARQPD